MLKLLIFYVIISGVYLILSSQLETNLRLGMFCVCSAAYMVIMFPAFLAYIKTRKNLKFFAGGLFVLWYFGVAGESVLLHCLGWVLWLSFLVPAIRLKYESEVNRKK